MTPPSSFIESYYNQHVQHLRASYYNYVRYTQYLARYYPDTRPRLPAYVRAGNAGRWAPFPSSRMEGPPPAARPPFDAFRHLPDKELAEIHHAAQDAATAGAIKYIGFSTVRAAIDNLKYLWFTKWTQSSNPIDDWEIQDSGNWTTPPNSTCSSSTLASSLTTPSDLNFLGRLNGHFVHSSHVPCGHYPCPRLDAHLYGVPLLRGQSGQDPRHQGSHGDRRR
jgi:hypothetical protein